MPSREHASGKAHAPVSVRAILLAVALAVAAGSLGGMEAQLFGLRLHDVYAFFGELFLNTLKMLIVPLVMSAIISGIGSLGDAGPGAYRWQRQCFITSPPACSPSSPA